MFSQQIPNLLAVTLKGAEARPHLNRTDKCGEAQSVSVLLTVSIMDKLNGYSEYSTIEHNSGTA